MGSYQKLHLANNLDALDLLAKRFDFDAKKLKFQQICNALTKLYKESQLQVLDQEITYILLHRYLTLYNHLKNTQSDKKFIEVRFGSEHDKVVMQYEGTRRSLEERYAALADKTNVPDEPIVEEKTPVEVKPKRIFDDEFITCQQLFSALQKNSNILLVDARPDNDFAESRIDYLNCINVPDHCITSGLSANALGKKLPPETQEIWELRDKYDVIVLYDWNASSDNVPLTKLSKLLAAFVEWDLNRNYSETPVILNGGYLELLQTYPTICTNPLVYLHQKNNELDELLELDNIKYPTESDNKTLVMGVPEDISMSDISEENEEYILEPKSAASRQELILQMEIKEQEKTKILEQLCLESNNNMIDSLKKRKVILTNEIEEIKRVLDELAVEKKDVDDKVSDETKSEESEDSIQAEGDPEKLKGIIDEERSKELLKARALKPKTEKVDKKKDVNKIREPEVPVINRATKPIGTHHLRYKVDPLTHKTSGLVGLRNIRNTCYMSTVIQCLRNVPAIMHLFCVGSYTKYNIRNPAAIVHEAAGLFRQLWSKSVRSIDPSDFYVKSCQLKATYKLGNHEDCMEFFLFLLNHLSEDCCYDIALPGIMTPKQRAWYNQFEGKNSVFIDLFYHQIRINQICVQCETKTLKFEIESTFMLSVPEDDFNVNELMDEYMADYVIADYCCSKCKKPVNNQKEICYEPKIVVIVLKRYRQSVSNGVVSLKKVDSRAHFQKRNFRLGNCFYHLNAIAMHSGDMNFGHYTAAALTPKGWYEFNDEMVKPININDDSLKAKACAFFYSMCDD